MRKLILSMLVAALASPAAAQTVFIERHVYEPVPGEVRTYVIEEELPSVEITQEIVVGDRVPDLVVLRDVPRTGYAYTVVNERRLIVEPETRRVISIEY